MTRKPALALAMLLSTAMAMMIASPSHACSCVPPKDAATALAGSHTVFEGRVVQSNAENAQAGGPPPLVPGPMLHRFEVIRSWKGEPEKLVTVRTPGSSASCGRSYKKGVSYLIYASLDGDGLLRDTLCTRTRKSSDADQDITILNSKHGTQSAPPQASAGEEGKTVPATTTQEASGDEDDDLSKTTPGCPLGAASQTPAGHGAWWVCALLFAVTLVGRRRD